VGEENGAIAIEVRDTGSGIPPDLLPRIFERFRQGESALVRGHGGLGLGLAIAKYLVERHGGVISAESDGQGQGAVFRVVLPKHELLEQPIAHAAPAAAEPLAGHLLLLVEDHEDARDALAYRLRACGARIAVAASARHALELYRSERPSLVLSDLGLPGESGFDLIAQIRTADAKAGVHTPAIAVSGFASGDDRREALAAGFDEYVAKPFEFSALMLKIRSQLPRSG
jgi:CheY-like chemotaxis protein